MAVTDLTDALPWWARQDAGPSGGPGAAPQGAGVGGQPPPGVDQQSWLNYLMQMFGPASANAAEVNPHGDGPPNGGVQPPVVGPGPISRGGPIQVNDNTAGPSGGGYGGVPPSGWGSPPGPPGGPPARPATGMGIQPGGLSSGALGAFNNMPPPSGGGSLNPDAPAPAAQTVAMAPSAANPLAGGGASGMGATSNPRFVQLDRGQNMDPTARRGSPQVSALNLAGLFGGSPGPGNPANVPASGRVAGPLAAAPGGGVRPGQFPYGRSTTPGGPFMPFDITGYPVAGVNAPLHSMPMNPDQLASAVKKRNWWQNV